MDLCDNSNENYIVPKGIVVYDVYLKSEKHYPPGNRSTYIVLGVTDELAKAEIQKLLDYFSVSRKDFVFEKLKPGTEIQNSYDFSLEYSESNKCVHVFRVELPF